jgi:hypothetical protein
VSYQIFICQTTDRNDSKGKRSKRQTHLNHENLCEFNHGLWMITFEKGQKKHNCDPANRRLLPSQDSLVSLNFGKVVFIQLFRNITCKAKRFAEKNAIGKKPAAINVQILELQNLGASVAYKAPWVSVDDDSVILDPRAGNCLKTNDLCIFITMPIQVQLLKRFGNSISTDGMHAVFSYNNVKVIAVLVVTMILKPNHISKSLVILWLLHLLLPKQRGY